MATTCILKCRTAEMGAHVSECDNCHTSYIHYNSCKNRHCPMRQGMEVDEWIDERQEDVLETPYFHTVFTIPSELYPLVYSNQRLLYDALYHAAHKTLTVRDTFEWTADICCVKVQKLNLKNKPFTEGLFAMQKNQKKMQI